MAKGDGNKIVLKFTQPLVGEVSGNEPHFDVSFIEPTFVPEGQNITVHRDVIDIEWDEDDKSIITLLFASGNQNSIQNAAGDIMVAYDGAGTLMGEGGPVAAFSESFTPEDLVFKGNQNDAEHIEIAQIVASGTLTKIEYTDASAGSEHVEIGNITAQGTLTHIGDL